MAPCPRAVVFDFDGTLVDSLEDIADAMNEVLSRHGFPHHPYEAYRHFVGDGMEKLVERALPEERRETGTLAAVVAEMREEYAGRALHKTRPYEGVPELLEALAARCVPVAICSNKPQAPLEAMTRTLLGRWSFASVVGARPDLPRKPDPTGALGIARDLGIAPTDWVYLGDTDTDMRTARAAGMRAAGVLWGFRSASELRNAGAELLLSRPLDLLAAFAEEVKAGSPPSPRSP